MRFIVHEQQGARTLAVRTHDGIVNLADLGGTLPHTIEDALQGDGTAALRDLQEAVRGRLRAGGAARLAPDTIRYLPPLPLTGKVFCVGLNYAAHAAEAEVVDPPGFPSLFARFPDSFVGHRAPLVRPRVSRQFDYEGELAVIIGVPGRYIAREDALRHIAGYTLFNDGSVRDYQFKSTQWVAGKNFDASGACGPELVSADELPPGAAGLQLHTRLNGTLVQDANTRDMIFDVAQLIAVCSEVVRLRPGDMIVTGTPAGVGFARKPPVFMQPGDVCEIEMEGIGILANRVIDEPR